MEIQISVDTNIAKNVYVLIQNNKIQLPLPHVQTPVVIKIGKVMACVMMKTTIVDVSGMVETVVGGL